MTKIFDSQQLPVLVKTDLTTAVLFSAVLLPHFYRNLFRAPSAISLWSPQTIRLPLTHSPGSTIRIDDLELSTGVGTPSSNSVVDENRKVWVTVNLFVLDMAFAPGQPMSDLHTSMLLWRRWVPPRSHRLLVVRKRALLTVYISLCGTEEGAATIQNVYATWESAL